jgi:transposase
MPIKDFLSQTQKEWLQQALRESDCPHFRKRILMLLLRNDGKNYEQIANFIGCSKRTVAYWCVHGNPEHLESLQDQREQGNHRKVTEAYIQLLLEVIEKEPEKLGYEFGRWTGERLATYLAEQTGIKLSGAQVRRILRQKKVCLPLSKTQPRGQVRPGKTEVIKQQLQM